MRIFPRRPAVLLCYLPKQSAQLLFDQRKALDIGLCHGVPGDERVELRPCDPLRVAGFTGLKTNILQRHVAPQQIRIGDPGPADLRDEEFKLVLCRRNTGFLQQLPANSLPAGFPGQHSAAGILTEPPVSEPIAATQLPIATDTAAPDDEPPGMREGSAGLAGVP